MTGGSNGEPSCSSSVGHQAMDTRFTQTLAKLLRPPLPGCIFIEALTHSDQVEASRQIRALVASRVESEESLQSAELHPALLGPRVQEVRSAITAAFEDENPSEQPQASASTTTKLMSSTISIFEEPTKASTVASRLLIFPNAHHFRTSHAPLLWSQLLHPPSGYTCILLSALPLHRWKSADGAEEISGGRPVVKLGFKASDPASGLPSGLGVTGLLVQSLPTLSFESEPEAKGGTGLSTAIERFKPTFVEYVYGALSAELGHGDVEELRYLTGAIWICLGEVLKGQIKQEVGSGLVDPAEEGLQDEVEAALEAKFKARFPLLSLLRPIAQSSLRQLHPRRLSLSSWLSQLTSARPRSSADTTLALLPPLSSLLLLSAFLASHLPPTSDIRLFLRDETVLSSSSLSNRRRKRRRGLSASKRGGAGAGGGGADDEDGSHGGRSNNHPLLLGPKPFTYQRLLYLFQNLAMEFQLPHPTASTFLEQQKRRETRSLGLSPEEDDEKKVEGQVDIYDLSIHRALTTLIQGGYILFLSPPNNSSISTSTATSTSTSRPGHAETESKEEDDAPLPLPLPLPLPPIPSRLEALTQATMRCNLLRDEVKALILGTSSSSSSSSVTGNGEQREGESFVDDGKGEDDRRMRRSWWERLEECGL